MRKNTPQICFLKKPIRATQRSQTKYESLCYHVLIMNGNNTQKISPIYDNTKKDF